MDYRKIKKILATIRHWPLHPQWFAYRQEQQQRVQIGEYVGGVVVDMGCTDKSIEKYLKNASGYIGLDYYQTATHWYATRPDVYGDAQQLPFADHSVDAVLLLDVLEHLPQPACCFSEAARILKSNGLFVLKVPFLYPLHDEPLDFQRWTRHGLHQLAKKHGFSVKALDYTGNPLETAGLLLNIALSKTLLNWYRQRQFGLILGLAIPPLIFIINIGCWLLTRLSTQDDLMPFSYFVVLQKIL